MAIDDIPGGRQVGGTAPGARPRWPWVVLFAVFGAALYAYYWASAHPAKPLAEVLVRPACALGLFLFASVVGSVLARRGFFHGLRFPLMLVPIYVMGLVPYVASPAGGWEGGWLLGIAGAAAGAVAGAVTGWLFALWELREAQDPTPVVRGLRLPVAFAVLFALFGAYCWATTSLATPGEAWAIALFPIVFAFLGILVGKPFLGMLTALPLVPLPLVPIVASLTVGWGGGWALGMAGAVAGAAAGAANGWLYDRWIMPQYEKRRARQMAARQPGSTNEPSLVGR